MTGVWVYTPTAPASAKETCKRGNQAGTDDRNGDGGKRASRRVGASRSSARTPLPAEWVGCRSEVEQRERGEERDCG
jgi:hypothetical protein